MKELKEDVEEEEEEEVLQEIMRKGPQVECYKCHKDGHYASSCRSAPQEKANLIEDKEAEAEPTLLLTLKED